MNTQLLFFLLGKKYGFNAGKFRKLAQESQYWDERQVREYQEALLQPLISHAYEHVPYYRALFQDNGISPDSIRSLEDLQKIPVTYKKDLIAKNDLFKADNIRCLHPMHHHTGGTTGTPCPYLNDRRSWAYNWILKMRTFEWGGFRYGKDRLGVMAGGSLIPHKDTSMSHSFWRKLNNYYSMPISHLDDNIMKEYYEEIRKQRIKFLRGYPSSIYTFAKYLSKNGLSIPMRAVFTTAEALFDYQRDLIGQVFGCKVFDTYGCGDGMGQASECEEHDGMHICSEVSIMEIVDSQGHEVKPGEEGEIVLTSLYDYSMPFIRYAPGDRAIKGADNCRCGRTGKRIAKLIGRSSDAFELSNGRTLNAFSFPLEALTDQIKQYQIVQTTPSDVEVHIVPDTNMTEQRLHEIQSLIEYHCGEGITVTVKTTDTIERPLSQKNRFILSKVSRDNGEQ